MAITRKFIVLLAVFLFVFCASVAGSYAATINSLTVSYSDVSSAVSSASAGDTVIVPAGSATWSSGLVITKGITLQGNGIDNTVITSGQAYDTIMIRYAPAVPANNETLRITGFTFDGNENSVGVEIRNTNETDPITNIRVDTNRFYHCTTGVVFGDHTGGYMGRVSGVVDSNMFDDCKTFTRAYGSYTTSWDNDPLDLGGPTGMYVEDNTMTMSSAWCSANPAALHHASSGWGGRYAYRFNKITYENGGWQDGFDVHGAQSCTPSSRGSVSIEIYNNTISYNTRSRFIHHRGGQGRIFNNTLTGTLDPQITQENYSRPGMQCCESWPCQDMTQGYYWNNINNSSPQTRISFTYDTTSPKDSEILHEDRDYWLHKASFDGSTGIGSGVWANRPGTCTNGVGYWATDKGGNWDKDTETANDGALYICVGNAWPDVSSPTYVPFTHPHPLRGPAPPSGLKLKN